MCSAPSASLALNRPAPISNVAFTDGTLVIDLTARAQSALVWRGVYHRPKSTAAKLAEYLPSTPQKLIAGYPPRS
jgi:hypothetical protein